MPPPPLSPPLFSPCSYSDQTTYGFFVDVGNGFTTLVPSILYALCMTWPLLPARVVGIMGMIKFYQVSGRIKFKLAVSQVLVGWWWSSVVLTSCVW
jgi:hypothetical protein